MENVNIKKGEKALDKIIEIFKEEKLNDFEVLAILESLKKTIIFTNKFLEKNIFTK